MLDFLWAMVVAIVVIFAVKLVWMALLSAQGGDLSARRTQDDLHRRCAYLVHRLIHRGVTWREMPRFLSPQFQGEWALVTHSMTAAALADRAFLSPDSRDESLTHMDRLLERVLLPDFRVFDTELWERDALSDLTGERGHIGYLGHLNFMLAAYHMLGGADPEYAHLFGRVTKHLTAVLYARPWLNAETYPGEIYIPDNAVVAASLALYDRVYPHRASGVAQNWLDRLSTLHDLATDLPVFNLDGRGEPLQMSRGSGVAWTIFYQSHVDLATAQDDYWRLKDHFWRSYAPGCAAVCEWPHCAGGLGDVDSGPLLLGMSPAATGFAMAGARLAGDEKGLQELARTAEMAGFSVQWRGRRSYLTAPLVGNAILTAMRTATPWDERWL